MVENKSKLKDYQNSIIVIVAAIFISLILVFLVLVPGWKSMTKTSEELKSAKTEQDRLVQKLENLKGLKEKEAQLKEQNAKVLAAIPVDNDVSRLFVEFEGIARDSGLTIKTVTEDPGSENKGLIIPVAYTVLTDAPNYPALRDALSKFEKALRLISINGVTVSASQDHMGIDFKLTAYKRGGNQ
jgi:Tfp pilus assembly protein PilO